MTDKDGPKAVNTTTHLCRQHILDATARCLDQWGYEATTIRRIATQLGCSVGSIYRYFRDKRDLMDAVAQQLMQPVAQSVEAGAPVAHAEQLYQNRARSAPQLYCLMFWLACGDGAERRGDASLPTVIRRVIDGWAGQLNDRDQAQRRWAAVHASVMLGATLRQMRPQPARNQTTGPSPSVPPDARESLRQAAPPPPGDLTPLPPGAPDHAAAAAAPPPLLAETTEPEPVEDVCLL